MRRVGWIVLAALTVACGAGWHRQNPAPSGALSPRQQVQVWQGGTALRWHAVRISADSVSGVPFLKSIGCNSCRTSVPLASVDSLRLGNPVAGFWKTVGAITGTFVLAGVIYCWKGCYSTD